MAQKYRSEYYLFCTLIQNPLPKDNPLGILPDLHYCKFKSVCVYVYKYIYTYSCTHFCKFISRRWAYTIYHTSLYMALFALFCYNVLYHSIEL